MALSAQRSLSTATHGAPHRRGVSLTSRPVRATVDYQSPSTRTGANELEALARMSNVVSSVGLLYRDGVGSGLLRRSLLAAYTCNVKKLSTLQRQ